MNSIRNITVVLSPQEEVLRRAMQKQEQRAIELGWTNLFYDPRSSPDMGKWLGWRARCFGTSPRRGNAELVPDFFGEVVPALDAAYPL